MDGVRRSPLFLEKSASSVLLCDQSQKLVSKSQEMTSGLSKKHHNNFPKIAYCYQFTNEVEKNYDSILTNEHIVLEVNKNR